MSSGSFTARFIDTGETWSFNAHGWPHNRADPNGNTINCNYNSDGSLASVPDSQGRVTTVTTVDGAHHPDHRPERHGRRYLRRDRGGVDTQFAYDTAHTVSTEFGC